MMTKQRRSLDRNSDHRTLFIPINESLFWCNHTNVHKKVIKETNQCQNKLRCILCSGNYITALLKRLTKETLLSA